MFNILFENVTGSAASTVLISLPTTFRPMVSEPINSSLFHQLAEQLQQQNLEQFQKQLLEHQQKVLTCSQICFSVIFGGRTYFRVKYVFNASLITNAGSSHWYRPFLLKGRTQSLAQIILLHPHRTAAKCNFLRAITNWMTP